MAPRRPVLPLPMCLAAREVYRELTGRKVLSSTTDKRARELILKELKRPEEYAKYISVLLHIILDLEASIKDLLERRRTNLYKVNRFLRYSYEDTQLRSLNCGYMSPCRVKETYEILNRVRSDVKLHMNLITAASVVVAANASVPKFSIPVQG